MIENAFVYVSESQMFPITTNQCTTELQLGGHLKQLMVTPKDDGKMLK